MKLCGEYRGEQVPSAEALLAGVASVWLGLAGCDNAAVLSGDADGSDQRDAVSEDGPEGPAADDGERSDAWDVPDVPRTCGDGAVDPGEECDDGNRMNGDGCDWRCRLGDGDTVDGGADPDVGTMDVSRDAALVEDTVPGDPYTPAADFTIPLVWTGTEYAVVWIDGSDPDRGDTPTFIRFGTDGRQIDAGWRYSESLSISSTFDMVWVGDGFALGWCPLSDPVVRVMILDENGKPELGPIDVMETNSTDGWMTLVWDGTALEVFGSAVDSSDTRRIRFVRLDRRLTPEVGPIDLDVPERAGPRFMAGASSGSETLVAVTEDDGSCGSDTVCGGFLIVSPTGEVLHRPARIAALAADRIVPAWGDGVFGITFVPAGPIEDVHLVLVTPDGDLVGPPRQVAPRGDDSWRSRGGIRGLNVAHGAGWAIAYAASSNVVLLRTDEPGACVGAWSVGGALPYPESSPSPFTWPAVDVAFDGSGFGIIGLGDTGPVFARYAIVR